MIQPEAPTQPQPHEYGTLRHITLWLLLFLSVIFLSITVISPGSSLSFDSEPVSDFSSGWVFINGSLPLAPEASELTLPTKLKVDGSVRIIKILPNKLPEPAVLCFRSSQQFVRLFLNNELIYSFGYDNPPRFGKAPGSAWNLVRLPRGSEGKQLLLELHSPYTANSGRIERFEIGSKAALLFSLLRRHFFSLAITLCIFTAGIIMLLAHYLLLRKAAFIGNDTLYLGIFTLIVSVWLFGECRLTQFFGIPPAFNTALTFVAMLAIPIPLINYIACRRTPLCRRLLEITARVLSILFMLSILLQMLGVLDFIEQIPVIHLFFALGATILLYAVIADTLRDPNAEHKYLMVSLGILVLSFSLEAAVLYSGGGSLGRMMRIGVLVFIAMQAHTAFQNAADMIRMSRLASVDSLTGCLNRMAYSQWIEDLAGEADVGVMIADINDLKMINDTFGHTAGDDAIIRCGRCLLEALSEHGRCFRIGGDEFAMLGKGLSMKQLADLSATLKTLNEAENAQTAYPFCISYGIAVYDPWHDKSLTDTVRRADKSMYQNKRRSKQNSTMRKATLGDI